MYIEWVLVVPLHDESNDDDTLSSFVCLWYKWFVSSCAAHIIVFWWVNMNVLETLMGPWLIDLVC